MNVNDYVDWQGSRFKIVKLLPNARIRILVDPLRKGTRDIDAIDAITSSPFVEDNAGYVSSQKTRGFHRSGARPRAT